MHPSRKAAALAASLMSALSAARDRPGPPGLGRRRRSRSIVVDDATIDWIEKSDVSALREGVIERMELQIGMPVRRGQADRLPPQRGRRADRGEGRSWPPRASGPQRRAKAQKDLAVAVVARNKRLIARDPNYVSKEEQSKAEAEVNVAEAMMIEAEEKVELDKADLKLAEQALDEHTIRAPVRRRGHPADEEPGRERSGPTRRSSRLGNLDQLRVWT